MKHVKLSGAAAALWLAALPAQAFCGLWGMNPEAQSLYEQCQAQERQADALERQNQILQQQRSQQEYQRRMDEIDQMFPPYQRRYQ